MGKYAKKIFNSKKIAAVLLEYILAIECLLLIFLLLKDNIDSNTIQDNNGIRWSYSIKNGNAENVCYHSGKLSEVVSIPETINGCPVISIKGNELGRNIFNSNENKIVKQVIIPNTVQNIGEDSFKNCILLETIDIPDTVKDIKDRSFEGCTNLSNVKMSNNITKISSGTFNGCSNLKQINLPKNISSIEKEAFQNCNSLENIYLQEGVQLIGDNAFSNCYNLKEISLPDTLQTCGESCFSYCENLQEITIPQNIKRIGYNTFFSCTNLRNVKLNNGLEVIGNDAFSNCTSLKTIILPSTIKTIGMQSFMNCNMLESIVLPKDLLGIEKGTFYNCSSLESVYIGNKVEKIEVQAFAGCDNLKKINIPSSIKDVGEYAFYGCSNLETINIDANNINYTYQDGMLYNKDKTELISCISNKESEITLLESVLKIRKGAFRNNKFIKKIYLDKNLKQIESFAFAECDNLSDIYLKTEKENVEFDSGWNINTYAYLHDINCNHTVEQVSDNATNTVTQIKCGESHTFKVAGSSKDMKVRIITEGDYQNSNKTSEIIKPNKDGTYKIENINRNKKILLQNYNDAGGVIVRYVDILGNNIENEDYIEGKIGEKYYTKPKNISGYGRIKDSNAQTDGVLTDDLIIVTYKYQTIDRSEINLFKVQDIGVYIIIILITTLINLIVYLVLVRKR